MEINEVKEAISEKKEDPSAEKKEFTKLNTNIDPAVREKYKQNYFKIKVAIFFGYNGKNYHGLQKNENVETIEGVLEQALYHADFIPPYNFDKLYKIGWGRGGRTDKGVHAVCNVINVKLCIHKDYLANNYQEQVDQAKNNQKAINKIIKEFNFKAIIVKINENLPKSIQVLAIKKVQAKFNVRKMARSRIYEYFCPITLFREMPSQLIEQLKKMIKDIEGTSKENQKQFNQKLEEIIIQEQQCKNYEYSQEEDQKLLEQINELCKLYIGTKNFHNFTVKLKWSDPSAKRYMLSVEAKLVNPTEILQKFPKLDERTEQIIQSEKKLAPFLLFRIHGQSFMYHQIRKMMGMVIQMIQEKLNLSYMQNAFYGNTYEVWLAPPEELFRQHLKVIIRNKFQKKQNLHRMRFVYLRLLFKQKEDQMQKFKEEMIYSQIIAAEYCDYKFSVWLGRQLSQGKNMDLEIEENEQDIVGDD